MRSSFPFVVDSIELYDTFVLFSRLLDVYVDRWALVVVVFGSRIDNMRNIRELGQAAGPYHQPHPVVVQCIRKYQVVV